MLPIPLFLLLFAIFSTAHEHFHDNPSKNSLTFQLRHLHTISDDNRILFTNVNPGSQQSSFSNGGFTVKTTSVKAHRPRKLSLLTQDPEGFSQDGASWIEEDIVGPNITDRETLRLLAKMTSNSYLETTDDPLWYDLGGNWTAVGELYACFKC